MSNTAEQYSNIPAELRALNRWVCWRTEERKGKATKVPVNPKPRRDGAHGMAMSNNPDTWASYDTALKCLANNEGLAGIGFMLGDGYVGVDIDECKEDGELAEHARDIVETLDSFTEYSPSGQGLHVICRGKLPEGRRQVFIERADKPDAHLGIYDEHRFFCMTGVPFDGVHIGVKERDAELLAVWMKYIDTQGEKQEPTVRQFAGPVGVTEEVVLERIEKGKNGSRIMSLLNGMWQGDYASQSEADMALMNHLAYYADGDKGVMWSIFRRSGLYRPEENKRNPKKFSATLAKAAAEARRTYSQDAAEAKERRQQEQESPHIDNGLEQLLKNDSLPEWIKGPYNDMWNAQRFVDRYGKDVRYNFSKGCWYIWTGKYWEEDRMGKIRSKVSETMTYLSSFDETMRTKYAGDKTYNAFLNYLARSRNTGKLDNTIKEAAHWETIAVLPEHMDKDPWLIACENGTIDLKTGQLLQHAREHLITKIVPVKYDRSAKAPTFLAFLNRIFDGKQDLVDFMQRAVGYSLTGSTKEQAVFVCHGSGANGKSTFIGVIQELLGEYARNTNFTTFTVRNDSNTNDIARLLGARFVTAMEVGEDKRLNEALVKQLTGGDKISARFLHKEFFDFIPTFKIWMGANHKPRVKETDNGIWRRLKLIPFEVTIPEPERDKDLPLKLSAELPGILAWAVEGCIKWQSVGLSPPAEVDAATMEYRTEMDFLQEFIDECIVEKPGNVLQSSALYKVYETWCELNGERAMSSHRFANKMKERGILKGRTRSFKAWENIAISDHGKSLKPKSDSWRDRENEMDEIPHGDDLSQVYIPWEN